MFTEENPQEKKINTSCVHFKLKLWDWILIWLSPGQIGSLQATQMAHEATIRNLDQEQSRLKEKISRLEEEREALLNKSQAANEQHKQQVLKLEQVLSTLHLSQSSLRG